MKSKWLISLPGIFPRCFVSAGSSQSFNTRKMSNCASEHRQLPPLHSPRWEWRRVARDIIRAHVPAGVTVYTNRCNGKSDYASKKPPPNPPSWGILSAARGLRTLLGWKLTSCKHDQKSVFCGCRTLTGCTAHWRRQYIYLATEQCERGRKKKNHLTLTEEIWF